MDADIPDAELLAMASAFDVLPYDDARRGVRMVRVESRAAAGDPPSWAIVDDARFNLNRDGVWECEPLNSSKTKAFLARARWSDARSAIAFARDHLARHPDGRTLR